MASHKGLCLESGSGLPLRFVSKQGRSRLFGEGRFSEELSRNSSTRTSAEHCSQCPKNDRFWDTPKGGGIPRRGLLGSSSALADFLLRS